MVEELIRQPVKLLIPHQEELSMAGLRVHEMVGLDISDIIHQYNDLLSNYKKNSKIYKNDEDATMIFSGLHQVK